MVIQTITALVAKRGQVSLPGIGRVDLRKPGLRELANYLGAEISSRATKYEMWDAIFQLEGGRELGEEALHILLQQLDAAWEADTVLEMGFKPNDDGDSLNTGIHTVGSENLRPVGKNSDGLEELIYRDDPVNDISRVEVRVLEELLVTKELLWSPWRSWAEYRTHTYKVMRDARNEYYCPWSNKTLVQKAKRHLIETFWDYAFTPSRHSAEYKALTREVEYMGKTRQETVIDALVVGFDTFFSTRGNSRGFTINRRNSDGDFKPLLHLSPTFRWKAEVKVAESAAKQRSLTKQEFIARFKEMADTLKDSFLGKNLPIILTGREIHLSDLRKEYLGSFARLKKFPIHPHQKLDAFLTLLERKTQELRKTRKETLDPEAKNVFLDLKAEWLLTCHRTNEAYNLVDHEEMDRTNEAIAALDPSTHAMAWAEQQWMSPTPQPEGEGQQASSTWQLLGEQREAEGDADIVATYYSTFANRPVGQDTWGHSTNNSRKRTKRRRETLNESGSFFCFVDPKVEFPAWKALMEEEAISSGVGLPSEEVQIPMVEDFEASWFYEASDDDLEQVLDLNQ